MSKKRFVGPDTLRGISILGVILIHITSTTTIVSDGGISYAVSMFINQIARFAVPAFLILSGWGLSISNKLEHGYTYFVKKQITKIIFLYFLWSIVYFLFKSEGYSIISFVKGLILGDNYYHLYYVPITILLYLCYPIILKIGKTNRGLLLSLIITVGSQLSVYVINFSFLDSPQNVFNWFFYFVFGVWLANDYERKLQKVKKIKMPLIVLLIISVAFIVSENLIMSIGNYTTSMRPSIIIYSICFILLVLSSNFNSRILNIFSKESYGVYLSHALILSLFEKIWDVLNFSKVNLVYVIMAFILTSTISLFMSQTISKIIKSFRSKKYNYKRVER